ncbi:MAG TPA: hypothetical protein VIU29_06780, partial [Candidatus Deferrimicrobiaceae bacterium]
MGHHSQVIRHLILAIALSALLSGPAQALAGRGKTMTEADAAVARFRTGAQYQPPPKAFFKEGKLLVEELEPFGPALRRESGPVREQIVRLLADAGKRADPLHEAGGQLIRRPEIVRILVEDGLFREDLGREAAL